MRPTIKAALLCDYALTSDDGKLSAVGIFSNINFASLPNAYPRFFVVIILTLDAGTHPVRLGIVDPIGQQMLPDPPEVDVQVELPGADTNLVIDFNNLPFNRAGIHQVQLFVSDLLVHSIPLSIQGAAASGLPPVRA
ncbi:MAG: hypothetical protein JOZ41_19590 [Chloroflexi bacterium]|nr:hypothetical protein [Chloroflexota bacterium]